MKWLLNLLLLLNISSVWSQQSSYQVRNYIGLIGKQPVHLSLQFHTQLVGSYYYDRFQTPLALYGKSLGDTIYLCEIEQNLTELRHLPEKKWQDCPFKLQQTAEQLQGYWQQGDKALAVKLQQVTTIDHNQISTPTIDIPLWQQTKHHRFVAVYQQSDSGLTVPQLKVIDKQQHRLIQIIDPQQYDCELAGTMTWIYASLSRGDNDQQFIVECYSITPQYWVTYQWNQVLKQYQMVDLSNRHWLKDEPLPEPVN